MADFRFEITEHLATLDVNDEGWTKELNLVSYNGALPKYDIRYWSPDHKKMSKGITMNEEEATTVSAVIADYYMRRIRPELFEDGNLFDDEQPAAKEPVDDGDCIITNIFTRQSQVAPREEEKPVPKRPKQEAPKKPAAKPKKTAKVDGLGDVELPF